MRKGSGHLSGLKNPTYRFSCFISGIRTMVCPWASEKSRDRGRKIAYNAVNILSYFGLILRQKNMTEL